MAEKKATKSKDNKNLIIGICAAVVVVIVIVVAVVVANLNKGIDDSYFVSDGTKYVLTINTEDMESDGEDEAYTPNKIHQVYTYSDDTITGLKYYYEYADAKSAQAAYDYLKSEAGDEFSEITVEGKYVIATAPEDSYKDYTASDVKKQIELMEMLQNMDTNESDTEDANDAEDTEEVEVTDEEEEEE